MPLGKLGRRAPVDKPSLKLGQILSGETPQHPAQVDHLSRLQNWQVLGNDRIGDCAAVTWANDRRLITAALNGVEAYPTFDQVIALYKTQNPDFDPQGDPHENGPGSSADGGMVLQTELDYLHKVGGPDGAKVVAFAKVDPDDEEELDAAISIFGNVWYGVTVQAANETEFDRRQAWDYHRGSEALGGHAVLGGGYTPDPRFITRGVETGFTDGFRLHNVEEVWVVIWPEHFGTVAFQDGVDQKALADAYRQLTGHEMPVPVVPPIPDPAPPGPPAPPVDPPAQLVEVPAAVFDLWEHHVSARHRLPAYERAALAAYRTARGQ